MDINYEDVFPSSEKEVGQMDVPVEEEELIRESIRRLILEISEFGCNQHSLGWIDPQGNFIDLTQEDESHDDWMERYQEEQDPNHTWWKGEVPVGWIKVSNTSEFWFEGEDWSEMHPNQVDAMIKIWMQCGKRHSRWIKTDAETRLLNFMLPDDILQLTIGDFLDNFGSREQQDIFFSWLMGES